MLFGILKLTDVNDTIDETIFFNTRTWSRKIILKGTPRAKPESFNNEDIITHVIKISKIK